MASVPQAGSSRRDLFKAGLSIPLWFSVAAQAPKPLAQTAQQRLHALLASTGGRERWAAARGYLVHATHYLAAQPRPSPNAILLDFSRPRLRIESHPADGWRGRVVRIGAGLRITDQGHRPLTQAEVAEETDFWRANVYRTLHRLASRDPTLTVALDAQERLVVLEGGKPLLWYRQNLVGEPIAFGLGTSYEGTIFGPLQRFGGLAFPSFSVRDGGRWRAIIGRFEVDPDLSDAAFDRRLLT